MKVQQVVGDVNVNVKINCHDFVCVLKPFPFCFHGLDSYATDDGMTIFTPKLLLNNFCQNVC